MKHLADFFFERHLTEEVLHAIGGRNPVVFVGVQRAVAVQIAEYFTVDGDGFANAGLCERRFNFADGLQKEVRCVQARYDQNNNK